MPDLNQLHGRRLHRQQYLPNSGQAYGILRIAEVSWGPGSINVQAAPALTVIRLLVDGCLDVADDSLGSRGIRAAAGDLLAHPQGLPYRLLVPTGGGPCRLWLVAVQGTVFADRWRQEFGAGTFHAAVANHDECQALLTAAVCRAGDGDAEVAAHCRWYLEQLLAICRRSWIRQRPADRTVGATFTAVKGWLDDHGADPLDLAAMAARFGCHRSPIHRWFRLHAGMSPMAYRQQLRLQQAAVRLTTSTEPVQVIAREAGFECPFAFSKAFKRHFGVSPSGLRES